MRRIRRFSASESAEIWDRWQRGEGLKLIGRVFGKHSSSIFAHLHPSSLLSIASSNSARSLRRPSCSSPKRIAQTSFCFRARFGPNFRPAFHAGIT
jgi:hypothetical protein